MGRTLRTVTEIADLLKCRRHQVVYAIRSRHIEPTDTVGIVKLYDGHALAAIREVVKKDNPQ